MTEKTIPADLAVRCHCGEVQGVLKGAASAIANRAICYCDDCQAFANYLSTDRGILDAHGGTDIIQISPARLAFTRGREHIACLRLTPKGALRWYTDCCRTPIGNTWPNGKIPFVGLIHSCLVPGDVSLDEVVGPVRMRVMARYAIGDIGDVDVYDGFAMRFLAPFLWTVLIWRFRGDHRHSPFFDPETLEPVAIPQIIDDTR